MKRSWTPEEIGMLGTQPDGDLGRLLGRPSKTVWAKRKALGIPGPPSLVRSWTDEEDQVVLSRSVRDAATVLGRTTVAVKIRRRKLLHCLTPELKPKLLTLEEVKGLIQVPRYDSKEQEENVRFVGGTYMPPLLGIGAWLKCELRGDLQVGGYSNALIPWPVAVGNSKQLVVCGDFLKALKTESRLAVAFHFGISLGLVSELRHKLGIERLTAGSFRLFRRTIDFARTDEARAKISRSHEGRGDTMTPEGREKLRVIQKRPKSEAWREKMTEFWRRRIATSGKPEKWTEAEVKMIGTMSDRKLARVLNRSLSSVKGKKFQLLKEARRTTASDQSGSAV